jgi:lipopolysaccharide/colanic/teichoic acid biosynthesis glycosyltransferase
MLSDLPTSSPARARWRARGLVLRWWFATRVPQAGKRALDIAVAGLALLLLAPLFAIVALLIRFNDRGPVLYWQRRVGRDGDEFAFPKFRSMSTASDVQRAELLAQNQHGDGAVTFKIKGDPRITPIGRFIRRSSIDELPQLWCVLRGDMSLVGPRPPLVSEVARYSIADRARLSVTPGLTCVWQVSGRAEIAFPEQVRMDMAYIREQSLWADVKLLAKTIPAVIKGRGAY